MSDLPHSPLSLVDDASVLSFDTLAVRAGHIQTHEAEHSEPLFLTSSFTYGSAAEAAQVFSGEVAGNIYSRPHT